MTIEIVNYKSLPISERIQLVDDIWGSIAQETAIPSQLSAEERVELHRRLDAHKADPSSSIPWEQVCAV
jgi:putative addiction module component (TIGR02574 family)